VDFVQFLNFVQFVDVIQWEEQESGIHKNQNSCKYELSFVGFQKERKVQL
jgi:hypothetical protein